MDDIRVPDRPRRPVLLAPSGPAAYRKEEGEGAGSFRPSVIGVGGGRSPSQLSFDVDVGYSPGQSSDNSMN